VLKILSLSGGPSARSQHSCALRLPLRIREVGGAQRRPLGNASRPCRRRCRDRSALLNSPRSAAGLSSQRAFRFRRQARAADPGGEGAEVAPVGGVGAFTGGERGWLRRPPGRRRAVGRSRPGCRRTGSARSSIRSLPSSEVRIGPVSRIRTVSEATSVKDARRSGRPSRSAPGRSAWHWPAGTDRSLPAFRSAPG
jgi:hypothetical protein